MLLVHGHVDLGHTALATCMWQPQKSPVAAGRVHQALVRTPQHAVRCKRRCAAAARDVPKAVIQDRGAVRERGRVDRPPDGPPDQVRHPQPEGPRGAGR